MRKNGRKTAQVEKLVKTESDTTSEWNTKSEHGLNSTSPELEARLRRLEATHINRSSSDVYKFAFFFFMGVALTVILYPKVSSSINSVDNISIAQSRNLKEEYVAEQLNEVGDTNKEELTSADGTPPDEIANRTLRRFEAKNEEELFQDQSREDHINHISDIENDDKKKNFGDNTELETKSVEAHERTEDLMIGETVDNDDNLFAGQSFKFVEVNEEDETVSIKEEDNEPKTIELFSENIDDIARGEPTETPNLKTKEKDTKPKRESTKGNPKKANKNKTKQNKNKVKDNDRNEDPKIPKEIRDFKPTYQKTLTPKKVFIDGRRIPPMELLPQKPNNSSVK